MIVEQRPTPGSPPKRGRDAGDGDAAQPQRRPPPASMAPPAARAPGADAVIATGGADVVLADASTNAIRIVAGLSVVDEEIKFETNE